MTERAPEIDQLLQSLTFGDDPFGTFIERSTSAGLPPIQVSAVFGQFLKLMARLTHADVVLEVGTLGGYSAAWLASGLAQGGRVISFEIDPHHAEVARENLVSVSLDDRVDVRVGAAMDNLPACHDDANVAGRVDVAFIDADKKSNPAYLDSIVPLCRPGAIVIVDNVVRGGAVLDSDSDDPNTTGTRDVLAMLGAHPRLTATALQTVGTKGHDGFAFAFVQ